jgi:hypothetical protein
MANEREEEGGEEAEEEVVEVEEEEEEEEERIIRPPTPALPPARGKLTIVKLGARRGLLLARGLILGQGRRAVAHGAKPRVAGRGRLLARVQRPHPDVDLDGLGGRHRAEYDRKWTFRFSAHESRRKITVRGNE